jgi:hypothetical protein
MFVDIFLAGALKAGKMGKNGNFTKQPGLKSPKDKPYNPAAHAAVDPKKDLIKDPFEAKMGVFKKIEESRTKLIDENTKQQVKYAEIEDPYKILVDPYKHVVEREKSKQKEKK